MRPVPQYEATVEYLPQKIRILGPSILTTMIESVAFATNAETILAQYYVVCSVSGRRIPVSELKYWSVKSQKPYASPYMVDILEFYPHLVDAGVDTVSVDT